MIALNKANAQNRNNTYERTLYMPQQTSDEANICLLCPLPECKGEKTCERLVAERRALKERLKADRKKESKKRDRIQSRKKP